jgi:hypothetical protein
MLSWWNRILLYNHMHKLTINTKCTARSDIEYGMYLNERYDVMHNINEFLKLDKFVLENIQNKNSLSTKIQYVFVDIILKKIEIQNVVKKMINDNILNTIMQDMKICIEILDVGVEERHFTKKYLDSMKDNNKDRLDLYILCIKIINRISCVIKRIFDMDVIKDGLDIYKNLIESLYNLAKLHYNVGYYFLTQLCGKTNYMLNMVYIMDTLEKYENPFLNTLIANAERKYCPRRL